MKLRVSYRSLFEYSSLLVMVGEVLYIWSFTRHLYYVFILILSFIIAANYGKSLLRNRYALLILASQVWVLSSDFLNGNIHKENIFRFLSIFSLMCLINHNLKQSDRYVWTMRNFFLGLSVSDIVFVFYDIVRGTYSNADIGLLGHKNYHMIIYLIATGLSFYCIEKERRKRKWCLVGSGLVLTLMVVVLKSSSSAVTAMIFILTLLSVDRIKGSVFNLYLVLIVDTIVFYFVIYKQYIGRFLTFILLKLGRDVGFTGRSDIWLSGFEKMGRMPFYGYGNNMMVDCLDSRGGIFMNHVHNFILHLIISGGWIYLALNLMIFLCAAHYLKREKSKLSKILLFLIMSYLIIGQTEILVGINNMLYPLLFMTVCIRKIGVKHDYPF